MCGVFRWRHLLFAAAGLHREARAALRALGVYRRAVANHCVHLIRRCPAAVLGGWWWGGDGRVGGQRRLNRGVGSRAASKLGGATVQREFFLAFPYFQFSLLKAAFLVCFFAYLFSSRAYNVRHRLETFLAFCSSNAVAEAVAVVQWLSRKMPS